MGRGGGECEAGVETPGAEGAGGSGAFPRRRDALETNRIVLGLLGGIGAGKSYVARKVAELGSGVVVDADELAHRALDACARDGRLESALGPGFVTEEGTADRRALASRVFEEPAMLRHLERLTHPAVMTLVKEEIHRHRRGQDGPVLVLDVPLLIEVGLDRRCDVLWFVDAPEPLRTERARARGLTERETELRERNQSPLERKRARADLVVRNAGDDAALEAQIREALEALGIRPQPQA